MDNKFTVKKSIVELFIDSFIDVCKPMMDALYEMLFYNYFRENACKRLLNVLGDLLENDLINMNSTREDILKHKYISKDTYYKFTQLVKRYNKLGDK